MILKQRYKELDTKDQEYELSEYQKLLQDWSMHKEKGEMKELTREL